MEWLSISLIGLSLALDAFVVSVINGLTINGLKKHQGIIIAITFGIFQGVMPVIGFFLGELFINYIKDFDHWIAFGLLLLIGAYMIFEGIKGIVKKEELTNNHFSMKTVIVQGIATSIDALAVGLTLSSLPIFIVWDALIITGITTILCLFGVFLGEMVHKLLKGHLSIANIIGGAILILIGLQILLEHILSI